jgi:protein SCO1/2
MQQKRIVLNSIAFVFFVVLGCQQEKKLPFLGPKEIGKQGDTLYHQIPNFKFLNQDSLWISQKEMDGKIYVADFFFTTCPTICPKMKSSLLRIYDKFAADARVRILSHTIDPEFDNVHVLKEYAKKLNITSPRWNL